MRKTFLLDEVDCPNCAGKLERAVLKIKGVQSATVNFFAQKLIVEADDEDFTAIAEQIITVSKKALPDCKVTLQ